MWAAPVPKFVPSLALEFPDIVRNYSCKTVDEDPEDPVACQRWISRKEI